MAQFRTYVRPGMRVTGSDGNDVGTVCAVRFDEFVVQRTTAGAVPVKFDLIQNVLGDEVILNVPSTEVGTEGPSAPPRRRSAGG